LVVCAACEKAGRLFCLLLPLGDWLEDDDEADKTCVVCRCCCCQSCGNEKDGLRRGGRFQVNATSGGMVSVRTKRKNDLRCG